MAGTLIRSMLDGEQQERHIHFGPQKIESIPLTALNELLQVRQDYDPEKIDELSTSIVSDPNIDDHPESITSEAFDLTDPIITGRHDFFSANQYIKDYASYYRLTPEQEAESFNNLTFDQGGMTYILIAGHRRKRSIYRLAEKYALNPGNITVSSSVYENITFARAMGSQFRENVQERPPVQDEARAIELFYADIKRETGIAPNIKRFAAQIGFSETKVRDALAFGSLPWEIQQLTYSGNFSFTIVRRFKPLADAFGQLYDNTHIEGTLEKRYEDVKHNLIAFAEYLLKTRISNNETRVAQLIENKIKEIFNEASYQGGLFFLEENAPMRRRDENRRMLTKQALQALQYQMEVGDDFDEDEIQRLDELVNLAKQAATERIGSQLEIPA